MGNTVETAHSRAGQSAGQIQCKRRQGTAVGFHLELNLTGAQRGAGQFLDGLAVTGQPSVEGGRVGAAAGSLLEAPPTAAVARRPLRPRGPAAVHCDKRGESLSP